MTAESKIVRMPTDFIRFDGPSSATVISDIVVGVEAEATPEPSEPEAQIAGGKDGHADP